MLLSILCLALTVMTCLTGPVSSQSDTCPGVTELLRGVPGSPGPQGVAGPPGSDGTSIKGDKGDTGDKGDPGRTRKSAFTAVKTSEQTGDSGDIVTFNEIHTNINGHFNPTTNVFTCVFPGTYSFTFSIAVRHNMYVKIQLVQNGNRIVSAYMYAAASDFDFASNSAILNLEAGDQVWLQFGYNGKTVFSNSNGYTSFSGILLYEN